MFGMYIANNLTLTFISLPLVSTRKLAEGEDSQHIIEGISQASCQIRLLHILLHPLVDVDVKLATSLKMIGNLQCSFIPN